MNLFTHIAISKLLYRELKDMVQLDKNSFSYGNIKPDIVKRGMNKPHTLENYLTVVCEKSEELIHTEYSIQDFSIRLGEICHYVCDFFCQYHLKDEILLSIREHSVYELKLHFKMKKITQNIDLKLGTKQLSRDICTMIKELRKEYLSCAPDMKKDIEYAFQATAWICESLSYFYAVDNKIIQNNLEQEIYLTQTIAGGQ